MKKLNLTYLQPQQARGFRYIQVPWELLDNPDYEPLDYGAVMLYSLMLNRAGWSAMHVDRYTDENGRLYIIYTVEQMMEKIHRSRPTVIRWTKQLVDIGLIEKVRQGQGKPSKIYLKDFASVEHGPENLSSKDSEPQEVKDFNFQKSTDLTSGSKECELQEVKSFNPIELEYKDLENINLPPYREGGVEGLTADVRNQVEYPLLCENYGDDLADEVVEIITETHCRDSPKMQIGQAQYPIEYVRKRMGALTFEHVAYALDNLGRAGPVRNPHNYLLALLFNAPAGCNAAVQAQYNADFAN